MKRCLIENIFWELRDIEISKTLEEAKEHSENISRYMHELECEIDKIETIIKLINE